MMLELLIAAAATAGPPALRTELEPLAFLAGHCWRGEFTGRGHVDTHCFEAVYDGNHLRDRHEVTGGQRVYRGETIYSWNGETRRVEYTYWNSLGGVSHGTMAAKGQTLDFGDETYTGADGTRTVIATEWRRNGADAYDAVSIRNGVTGDKVVTYRRVN